MAGCVEHSSSGLGDRGIQIYEFEPLLCQNNDLKNPYFPFPIVAFGIIKLGQGVVSSASVRIM